MNDNDISALNALQTRLDRLEGNLGRLKASNRLLTWALLGLLAMGAFLFILSAAAQPDVQDVVRARAFEVVDADGNKRIELNTGWHGTPNLEMFDAGGKITALLSITSESSAFLLFDAAGNPRMTITEGLDFPGLTLTYNSGGRGKMGFMRVWLNIKPDGTPELFLDDANGKRLFSAP